MELPAFQHHSIQGEIELDYDYIKRETLLLTGIHLDSFKEPQMKRRIGTLMSRKGAKTSADFIQLLKNNPQELDFYTHYITINVTEFFRDPDHWRQLEESILPQLIARFGTRLKVWSSACSTGQEPYSLAMCLSHLVPLSDIHIIATDLDTKVLDAAQAGIYPEDIVENVPADLLDRFFIKEGGDFHITEELKQCVEFHRLDLHENKYPQECHLIVCRNVLIYFTSEAKDLIFENFRQCSAPGSCLFLGKAEQIINWKNLGYQRERPCFYFQ